MIWLNGRLIPSSAAIDAADRGFTLGDGLFETIRAAKGHPLHLDRHLARLRIGAGILSLPVPEAPFEAAMTALLRAEGLTEGILRLTLTRGPAGRGLLPPADPRPTLLITAQPAAPVAEAARLVIATVTRRNPFSPLARIKSLNGLDNILARQEASARGADDAVLLNTAGRVAETTIANLFLRIGDRILTPPVAEGALPGIARAQVMSALGAVECPVAPEDLRRAEEVVLTNSLGVRRVTGIDGTGLGGDGAETLDRAIKALLAI